MYLYGLRNNASEIKNCYEPQIAPLKIIRSKIVCKSLSYGAVILNHANAVLTEHIISRAID